MKILNVVGARPNFMKIVPLIEEMGKSPNISQLLVHTGQHYDEKMSKDFFIDLGLPEPDINLEVGPGSHAKQTAAIMERFEPVVIREKPDLVLVVGDVNSTIACALTASKLNVRVAHVEAGLRSFDRSMPEEINRILTDSISDYLFTTEDSATENLKKEGVDPSKVFFVGNVMIDTLLKFKQKAMESAILSKFNVRSKGYVLVTLHRPGNVDSKKALEEIIQSLEEISKHIPVIFPCHPRTRERLMALIPEMVKGGQDEIFQRIRQVVICDPLGYLDFMKFMAEAKVVITDSGGIQEETTILGVPCLTIRPNTERPVTISHGTNKLVDAKKENIILEALEAINCTKIFEKIPPLWDGKAGKRIIEALTNK